MHASTWADDIKRKNDYRSDPVTGPAANLNKAYADKNKQEYWHCIDIPFSTDGSKVVQPVNPNALTQIRLFTQTLSSNASDDIRSYDLVWLLHLVGDVHQLRHATARFSKNLDDDRSGNDEKVLMPGEAEPIALHLWDRLPGAAGTPADAIAAAKVLPESERAAASVDDPALWLIESFTIAQNDVYRPAILDGEGPFALDQAYVEHAQKIACKRVALAGARLGALLNQAMK